MIEQMNVATQSVQRSYNRVDVSTRTEEFQLTNAHLWTLHTAELQFLSSDKCGTTRCDTCHFYVRRNLKQSKKPAEDWT